MEDGEQTSKTDTTGKGDNSDTPNVEDNKDNDKINNNSNDENPIDRAEAANKEKARLIEEDKKLMDRKEKLHAAQMVGGHTVAGESEKPKEVTPKEYVDKIMAGEIGDEKK